MAGELGTLLGIFPASAEASATTGVKEARVAKENSKGQAHGATPVKPQKPEAFDWSRFGGTNIETPQPRPAAERAGELQGQSDRPAPRLACVRRFAEGDIPALQRMLAHVGSAVPSNELVAQSYPLSFVLEDEIGQVRGGLFGSITYQSAFLLDPLADNSRDPFEDFAALLYPAEQEMREKGIERAAIWVFVPPTLQQHAVRLQKLGFIHQGFNREYGLDLWVSLFSGKARQ